MSELKIENFNLWYGRFHALKDISLPAFMPGEFIGVIGPNAAGKSSFLQALIWPKRAKARMSYDGRPLMSYSRQERTNLFGLMTQTPPQPTSLTPYELLWSLARALQLSFSDKELEHRIEMLFEKFGLVEDGFKALHSLSGGKRQLVGAAMVLLRSPSICLLDEPTSALDLHWRLIVLDELRDYVRVENKIAIAALHDMNLALRYCDRLMLIDKGELIAFGKPGEVLTEANISSVFHVKAVVQNNVDNKPHIEIIKALK